MNPPPHQPPPLLQLEDVDMGYGQKVVLHRVNVRLARGCFTGVIGSNGSGKTTFLKTLLGVIRPLAGRIQLQGASGQSAVLGYVPQTESLSPLFLLSGFEVALMGVCGRVGPGRFVPRLERNYVEQCLERVGASDFARESFAELSGGQKQRVLIARALAMRPDLLLLDEPTSGLDHAAAKGMADLLRRLHAEENHSILMVNHDLALLRACVQDVLWLHDRQARLEPAAEWLAPGHLEKLMEYSWN